MTETSSRSWAETDQLAVRAQLDRILNSDAFKQSKRRQRFLSFLINETLAGRKDRLKSYTIATEVFDRPDTFDPLIDPIVRIEAGRLRDKLRLYYAGSGIDDTVLIDLPKGSYAPSIDFRASQPHAYPPDQSKMRWGGLAASAIVVFALIASVGFWLVHPDSPPSQVRAVSQAGARSGPVIAVLPFSNLGGDPDQKYFSDGLTEDILIALSRSPDLSVLSRHETFPLEGQSEDIAQLARALRADYALLGSVRRAGSRLRVTAQLLDTRNGHYVWADRFDREMSDVLLVQDEIVGEIVAKLAGQYGVIDMAEAKLARLKSANQIEAYDLVLRAQDALRPEWNRAAFAKAKALLARAVSIDPTNARAHRELSFLAAIGWVFHLDPDPMRPHIVTALAVKATKLDPSDARAHLVAASAYFWTNQLDLFESEASQALALAPYDAEILATIGCMVAKSSQWQRGVAMVEKAHALNAAAAAGWYEATMSMHGYLNGDYQHALTMMRQAPDQNTFYAYIDYIPIYGQLGRKDEARAAWMKLRAEEPDLSGATIEAWFRRWNMSDEDVAKLMGGFARSGVLGAAP